MKALPRISDAEWEVMEVLWRRSPLASAQIVADLAWKKVWKEQTIRTMLTRLVQKGAVGTTAAGRVFSYRPLVLREACVRQESESFLDRVFAGTTQTLLMHFVQTKGISFEDLDELKEVLKTKKKGNPR